MSKSIPRGEHPFIDNRRDQIDAIDAMLIIFMAWHKGERDAIVSEIGSYKSEHGLPIGDSTREEEQREHLASVAVEHGFDPLLAISIHKNFLLPVSKDIQASLADTRSDAAQPPAAA